MLRYEIKGFVLMMVLICLQIALLFGLYALHTSSLEILLSYQSKQKQDFLNQLDQIHKTLESQSQEQLLACKVPIIALNDLYEKPISWWQTESCAGNFQSIHYYYVVELLGEDACALVKWARGRVANYYRLTLFGIEQNTKHQLLVQSTFVEAVEASASCSQDTHQVALGRQSWRYVVIN